MLTHQIRGATITAEPDPVDQGRWCIWVQVRPRGSKHWCGSIAVEGEPRLERLVKQHHVFPFAFSDEAVIGAMKVLGLYSYRFEGSTLEQMYRPSVDRADSFLLHWCSDVAVSHQAEVRHCRETPWPKTGTVTRSTRWSYRGDYDGDRKYVELTIRFDGEPTVIAVRESR
jgi:hypothetical protein